MLDDILDEAIAFVLGLFGGSSSGKSTSRHTSTHSPTRTRVPCPQCGSRTDMIGCTNRECANHKRKK